MRDDLDASAEGPDMVPPGLKLKWIRIRTGAEEVTVFVWTAGEKLRMGKGIILTERVPCLTINSEQF